MNKEKTTSEEAQKLAGALWRIYNRAEVPQAWENVGNLPWNDPAFSERMLREHLDQSHGAASRIAAERHVQLDWLWEKLALREGARLLDVTCGPGLYAVALAERGVEVLGIDFAPASVAYARELAQRHAVSKQCSFVQADVRQMDVPVVHFDAALFLYGQLAVFRREEAQALLAQIAAALKPGGALAVELLNQDRVDKTRSTWWYTDDTGIWGDRPFLHLGERFWLEDERLSVERFHIIELETGELTQVDLCDQSYAVAEMNAMLRDAGFETIDNYPTWDGLPLYDAQEWQVYVARKAGSTTR